MIAPKAHFSESLRPIFLVFISFILCVPLLLTCCSLPFWGEREPEAPEWLKARDTPIKVAVLPFENLSPDPELAEMFRRSFYSQFALKNYRDIELKEVDRALQILQTQSTKPWRELSPQLLGDFFQADFLLYGKVVEYSRFFAGVYSQVAMKVTVEMVECSSGMGVWWKAAVKRSHEGGVPFSLFGIVPEALRSGFHMRRARTLDLIDRLNRELVAEIPDPPLAETSPYFLDIQVGSFLEKELALKSSEELQGKGYNNVRVEEVRMGDRTYHRVLLGPYKGAAEADAAKLSLFETGGFKPILIHHRPERKSTLTPPLPEPSSSFDTSVRVGRGIAPRAARST